jgi:transposase-like protein
MDSLPDCGEDAAQQEENMSKRTRRNHSPTFKAKVALAAIKGEKTLAELAQLHDMHPTEIMAWKAQLVEGAAALFGAGSVGKSFEPERQAHRQRGCPHHCAGPVSAHANGYTCASGRSADDLQLEQLLSSVTALARLSRFARH